MHALTTAIDCVLQLLIPWIILIFNTAHIPLTALRLIKTGESRKLLSASQFRAEWFAHFWSTISPSLKSSFEADLTALLQGRVSNGKVHDTVVSSPISGVVLEIGPGPGTWSDALAAIANVEQAVPNDSPSADGFHGPTDCAETGPPATSCTAADANITKIYGIELNLTFAATLRTRIAALNLPNIYEVVPLGIEEMLRSPDWQDRIHENSVDSIICICYLCSIPNPQENMRLLHKLLKPGGRWYIHEHVRATRGGFFMKAYQRFLGFFYSPLMGGCELCRPTLQHLLKAGTFAEVDVAQPVGEPGYTVIPWIIGTCTA